MPRARRVDLQIGPEGRDQREPVAQMASRRPAVAVEPAPAFMPVLPIDGAPAQAQKRQATQQPPVRVPSASPVRLPARLTNGVAVELECTGNDAAQALNTLQPPRTRAMRYQPPERLLQFLEGL